MAAHTALQQPLELDLFEGPFDLLLTLVLREEVDLFELPVAELVEAALGGDGERRWDPDTAGELIIVLAATAELKARRLLGEPMEEEPDQDALEARERLAARLIAYAPFQRAAEWLAARWAERGGPRYRRVPVADARAAAPPGDPAALAAALNRLLETGPEPSLAHLTDRRVSLPELLTRLRDALARGRAVSFERLVGRAGRLEEGMTLIAALELARRGEVRLSQPEPFGDISMQPTRRARP